MRVRRAGQLHSRAVTPVIVLACRAAGAEWAVQSVHGSCPGLRLCCCVPWPLRRAGRRRSDAALGPARLVVRPGAEYAQRRRTLGLLDPGPDKDSHACRLLRAPATGREQVYSQEYTPSGVTTAAGGYGEYDPTAGAASEVTAPNLSPSDALRCGHFFFCFSRQVFFGWLFCRLLEATAFIYSAHLLTSVGERVP